MSTSPCQRPAKWPQNPSPSQIPSPRQIPTPTEPAPEPQRSAIPSFVEYSPSELRNYALGAVLVVASVAAVITLFLVAPDPDTGGFVLVLCLGLLAAAAGWGLASWKPTVVSIRDGILEVSRGDQEDTYDLRDPDTRVDLGTRTGSPSWRAKVASPDGPTTVITAREVKARHFTEIVEHHRGRRPEQ